MPVSGSPENLYLGYEFLQGDFIKKKLELASDLRFDFICLPLNFLKARTSKNFCNDVYTESEEKINGFICKDYTSATSSNNADSSRACRITPTCSDLLFSSATWSSSIIATLPNFLQPDEDSFHNTKWNSAYSPVSLDSLAQPAFSHEDILWHYLRWASHLGVFAILCPPPTPAPVRYARILQSAISGFIRLPIWIRIPLVVKKPKLNAELPELGKVPVAKSEFNTSFDQQSEIQEFEHGRDPEIDGWLLWHQFRTLCDFSANIHVALEFTDLPDDFSLLDRWFAEPVKAVIIPSSLFISNREGYPVLPVAHKIFLNKLFRHNVYIILKEETTIEEPSQAIIGDYIASDPHLAITSLVSFSSEKQEVNSTPISSTSEVPDLEPERTSTLTSTLCTSSTLQTSSTSQIPEVLNRPLQVVNTFESSSPVPVNEEVKLDMSFIMSATNYVARLFKSLPPLTKIEEVEYPLWDCLQLPLQPLQDNLESRTYEVFEKDPVKYAKYKQALILCLENWLEKRIDALSNTPLSNGVSLSSPSPLVIFVVGAGRGPLVDACLEAIEETGISDWHLVAVEKNLNAYLTLLQRVEADVNSRWRFVQVIKGDMRCLKEMVSVEYSEMRAEKHATYSGKADVVVSELLGSFSDNELSPECLDGFLPLLKEGGVSIPSSYTSYLEPISTNKLWTALRQKSLHYESPYVVYLHSIYRLSCDGAKPCFRFEHIGQMKEAIPHTDSAPKMSFPIATECSHCISPSLLSAHCNDRETKLTFTARSDGLLHGFSGYFECVLYGDIILSTVPSHYTPGLFSWFPMFFPLREAVFVYKGQNIQIHFSRRSDSTKVWYEWCLTQPTLSYIHNCNGRSYSMQK